MEAVNLATPVFGPMTFDEFAKVCDQAFEGVDDFHSFPTSPEHTLALLKNLNIGAPNPDTRALCRVALDALDMAKADGDVDGIILAYEKGKQAIALGLRHYRTRQAAKRNADTSSAVIRSQQNALLATDEATKMHELATEAFQNTMAEMSQRHAEKLFEVKAHRQERRQLDALPDPGEGQGHPQHQGRGPLSLGDRADEQHRHRSRVARG